MHWITSSFMVLLCTFLKIESLLFHGQTNATSASNGHSDPDVYKQLLQLETDLVSIMKDQKQQAQKQTLLEGEILLLRQWNQTAQMKISLLESENKILKERQDNLNSSSTLPQHNLTSEDLKRLKNILAFEIEQTVRDSEERMMKNMSATITDLELRDRYLSLSLLDANNNTAGLSSSLSNLDAQQKRMKSEIETLTNLQQNDITKLNDTIIHLKNRVQSKVAFTAGIIGENGGHTYTGTVIFPNVIYQVGGGYNPTTGVFTAPKAGLYFIFCTNVAERYGTFWTLIKINGSIKAGVMAYVGSSTMNVHQSASNLVVHQLQVGDRVWIQVTHGSHLYSSYPETTFSVIMINGSD